MRAIARGAASAWRSTARALPWSIATALSVFTSCATRILIDCGFGVRETSARLYRLGVAPESVAAIIVTHEHSDHIGGVAAFAMRYQTPVWLTFGTFAAVAERFADLPQVRVFDAHD